MNSYCKSSSADFPNLPAKAEKKGNALYEVPYLYEAREFLRKKLIGKKVIINVFFCFVMCTN